MRRHRTDEKNLAVAVEQTFQLLENQGKLLWIRNDSGVEHRQYTRKDGSMSAYRRAYGRKGSPDYVVVMPKQTIFVELKTAVGRSSPEQIEWQYKTHRLGIEYYLVRSTDELDKTLWRFGISLTGRQP